MFRLLKDYDIEVNEMSEIDLIKDGRIIINSNVFPNKLRDHIYLQLSAIFMIVFKVNFTKKTWN